MANAQALKRRVRSVSNTKQITKAMELVSAAKMRRVVEAVTRSRIYSDSVISILQRLDKSVEAAHNPYFSSPSAKTKLYIIFSSDSGLAGAYNSNIFSLSQAKFEADRANNLQPNVIAFGRKGAHHFSHNPNVELIGDYEGIADDPDANVFGSVLDTIITGVANKELGGVELIYTEFRSSLNQKAVSLPLIPISSDGQEPTEQENTKDIVFEFEPNVETVLDSAIRLYLESSLRRARVEAAASEHAMRMMSMNNANRNAGDLIDNLTLELNATRQAAITQEMAEIIGGADAIA